MVGLSSLGMPSTAVEVSYGKALSIGVTGRVRRLSRERALDVMCRIRFRHCRSMSYSFKRSAYLCITGEGC